MHINLQDIIGKTEVEIFTGSGVKECQDFKREVMEKGVPAKKEITYETELFGSKTFLMYVEPVFSKTGETIGVNYVGMEITDQVKIVILVFEGVVFPPLINKLTSHISSNVAYEVRPE